jgi:hypothetical protein
MNESGEHEPTRLTAPPKAPVADEQVKKPTDYLTAAYGKADALK